MVRPVATSFGRGRSIGQHGSVWRERGASRARRARADAISALLCERARACVDGSGIRRVGHGDVLGALLDVLGLGSCAGCVCAVCVPPVGFLEYQCDSRVLILLTTHCSSVVMSEGRAQLKIIGCKRFSIICVNEQRSKYRRSRFLRQNSSPRA